MYIRRHLSTVRRHRQWVRRYCFRLGLYRQGLLHDLSKYSPTEFWRGARYWQGYRSPNDAERAANGVSLAWLHHKGRNRHHFEYWIDYVRQPDGRGVLAGTQMPLRYVAEMFCDRIAACRIYHGKDYTDAQPYEYFARSRPRMMIHEKTADELEKMLLILKEQGEDAAFSYVRRRLREEKSAKTREK